MKTILLTVLLALLKAELAPLPNCSVKGITLTSFNLDSVSPNPIGKINGNNFPDFLSCPPGTAAKQISCEGSYCDFMTLYCAAITDSAGHHYSYDPNSIVWTDFVSDETQPAFCPDQKIVIGLSAQGDYSDNIKLQCASIIGTDPVPNSQAPLVPQLGYNGNGCDWTPFFSEEGTATQSCSTSEAFIRGLACNGDYCDNMALFCCSGKSNSCQISFP